MLILTQYSHYHKKNQFQTQPIDFKKGKRNNKLTVGSASSTPLLIVKFVFFSQLVQLNFKLMFVK